MIIVLRSGAPALHEEPIFVCTCRTENKYRSLLQGYHNPLYSQSLVMHIYLSIIKLSKVYMNILHTTMHVLITRHLLPFLELMDIPCSKDHLLESSLLEFDSSKIGHQLQIILQNHYWSIFHMYSVYEKEGTDQQRMLLKWRAQQGSGATYLKLYKAFISCGYNDAADKVQQMATAFKGMFIRGWAGPTCTCRY